MAPGILASPPSHQTNVTNHFGPTNTTPSSDQALVATLTNSAYTFLQPPPSLHTAALVLAKRYLDPLAASTSEAQTARLQATRKKRKRGEIDDQESRNVLRLKQVHLEGFGIDQVWEQARKVLDASRKETERNLPNLLQESASHSVKQIGAAKPIKIVRFDDEGFEVDSDEEDDGLEDQGDRLEGEDEAGLEDAELDQELDGEEDEALEDIEDIEEDSDLEIDNDEDRNAPSEQFVADRHGLNDGFFSIDDFNRNTDFLEQQDAKGDPDDGAASDEEEVDWEANPSTRSLSLNPMKSRPTGREDDESLEEDGPTFGNADLNAPFSDDDDDELDEEMDLDNDPLSNTNDIHYADFFEPPPQAKGKGKGKGKSKRALAKTQPPSSAAAPQPTEEDIQRTISSVRRDIFEDDDISNPSDEGEAAANDPSLSTHERRQAALAAQIRALESEAVAKREWTLQGEARAADRPLNSLLEEDLEFERAGKPVPVITAEVSESIEELIKQRILDRNFDEVPKRRPGAEALQAPAARRGLVDLDTRNDQSLAEVYEQDHQRLTDPNYVDKRDAKLKAAHGEIEKLWKEVSGKLDALSSFHYKPKLPDVEVSVVTDAPRITMEDARPSGVGMGAEQSGLAPQEVYKPGEEKEKGEIVTKKGGVVGQAEMTREEKLRRRRREKERIKKRSEGQGGKNVESKRTKEKKDVVGELKKGGVKVIGKGGEIQDVEGNQVKKRGLQGGGGFKL
ncbi:MAG: U3 snoRNP protein [Stictis urceolatum]|nr:U3 snoRNP protein [Stictis urceolata]